MSFIDFPDEEDWSLIYNSPSLNKLWETTRLLSKGGEAQDDPFRFFEGIEAEQFIAELKAKILDLCKSYVFIVYYHNKGIPDTEWFISPGKNGASVQYFPHFDDIHFYRKGWFDYFSEVFYYKLFSCFDTLGHLLRIRHRLNIKKHITFYSSVNCLESTNQSLYSALLSILHAKRKGSDQAECPTDAGLGQK